MASRVHTLTADSIKNSRNWNLSLQHFKMWMEAQRADESNGELLGAARLVFGG
jgi:hypothetical protein